MTLCHLCSNTRTSRVWKPRFDSCFLAVGCVGTFLSTSRLPSKGEDYIHCAGSGRRVSGNLRPLPPWAVRDDCRSLTSLSKPWLLLPRVGITDYSSFSFFLHQKWVFREYQLPEFGGAGGDRLGGLCPPKHSTATLVSILSPDLPALPLRLAGMSSFLFKSLSPASRRRW